MFVAAHPTFWNLGFWTWSGRHTFWNSGFWTWGGWSFFVAAGTLGLAFFTWRAVRKSSAQIELQTREVTAVEAQTRVIVEQAAATTRQAEVSAAALVASTRPVLVADIPPPPSPGEHDRDWENLLYPNHAVSVRSGAVHYEETDYMLYLSFYLRNIGVGVAFVQAVALLVEQSSYPAQISPPIIAPGEMARVLIGLRTKQIDGRFTDVVGVTRAGRGFAEATVGVVYTGPSPELSLRTEVTVSELVAEQRWLVTGTSIWENASTEFDDSGERVLLAATPNIGG